MINPNIINPNVLDEGNQMEILDDSKYLETHNVSDLIVRCNNCGLPTRYGETRMCSGFVGCDNKIDGIGECYFDDLMPRVIKYHDSSNEEDRKLYRSGKLYRWRDGAK